MISRSLPPAVQSLVVASTVCFFLPVGFLLGYRYHSLDEYTRGFKAGATGAWEEFRYGMAMYSNQAVVPLYEGGEPSGLLYVVRDIPTGSEERHLMIRKVGHGYHWDLDKDADRDWKGFSGDTGADYIPELLKSVEAEQKAKAANKR